MLLYPANADTVHQFIPPKEKGMCEILVFVKKDCKNCAAAKKRAKELDKEGYNVIVHDLDTVDGLAESAFYSVMSTPTILIKGLAEVEKIRWSNEIPTLDEVRTHYGGS